MPVRKIRRSYRSITGRLLVDGSMSEYESTLERDFLAVLRFNKQVNVKDFEVQPERIPFKRKNRTYSHVPDLLIHYWDELNLPPELCEVKPRNVLRKE